MFGKKLSTSCRKDTLLSALHKKNRFWEELWKAWRLCFAAAVTDSCGKLSGATFTIFGVSFHNKNFKEQFSLATLRRSALQNGFGEPFLVQTRSLRAFWKTVFGSYLWRSTVEHLCGSNSLEVPQLCLTNQV